MVLNDMSELKCAWPYIFEPVSQDVTLFFTLFMHLSKECLHCKSCVCLQYSCVYGIYLSPCYWLTPPLVIMKDDLDHCQAAL